MSAHEEQKEAAIKQLLSSGLRTGRLPDGEYETVQDVGPGPTCIITNCRRRLVKGEALCRKHLGR